MTQRKNNIVKALPASDPEIGRLLWMFEDARSRTMEVLERVRAGMVDRQPDGDPTSIGSVLYHIAAIEADWLYEEVLVAPFPEEVIEMFPHPIRDEEGRLTLVTGESLESHLERLDAVRVLVLDVYREMDLEDYRRVRELPDYDVTPEWVLHHLLQHEAQHRGEIDRLRILADRSK